MSDRVIGILGGMGPAAGVELCQRILQKTPAHRDQDHFPVLLYNNAKVPDRTRAMLYGQQSPVPALQETARKLERAGADFICMPCNTAHYYLKELQSAVQIQFVDMIRETAARVRELQVGVLSTEGTVITGLYHDACSERGREVLTPGPHDQRALMEAIYNIKAGRNGQALKRRVVEVGRKLVSLGAEALIIGCTEISLVVQQTDFPVPAYDSLDILADAAVLRARA